MDKEEAQKKYQEEHTMGIKKFTPMDLSLPENKHGIDNPVIDLNTGAVNIMNSSSVIFDASGNTAVRTYTLQDQNGVVALQDQQTLTDKLVLFANSTGLIVQDSGFSFDAINTTLQIGKAAGDGIILFNKSGIAGQRNIQVEQNTVNVDGDILGIYGANGNGSANGGRIEIISGNGGVTSGNGGEINIRAGDPNEDGNGGDVSIITGVGGNTTGNGGDITLSANDAPTSGDGGDVKIQVGATGGGGVDGRFRFLPKGASTVEGILDFDSLTTSDKTFTFPDQTGTLALVGDNVSEFTNDAGYLTTVSTSFDRSTGQTGAKSLAAYSVGASDSSFIVSANVLVTTATLHNFIVTCAYTDEGNTARTLTFTFSNVGATLGTLIANAGGAVPYEGIPLHIRAKASTTITIASANGGGSNFTTVVYNLEGSIVKIN